jgi:hypothetical protein
MTRSRSITQKIFIWTYERGTLSYDIICILILAFIFFVPPSCFHKRQYSTNQSLNEPSQVSQPVDTVTDQGDSDHENK